jgi:hypothetical protein
MLLVQDFLETHTLAELAQAHGVYASFSKSGHKFSLNYDQLESKEDDPLAQECRGLILASENNGQSFRPLAKEIDGKLRYDDIIIGTTDILAYPMRRFFNYGQGAAANVNWSDPKLAVLEKLDGTLTILYHDKFAHEWCVATRSVPDADVPLDNGLYTFRTLFEKALKDTNGMSFEEFTSKLDPEITYCFELTSPYNRIVVDYKETKITLIAARRVVYAGGDFSDCFDEIDIDKISTYGVPHVHAHTFTCVSDLVDWVSTQNPLEHEGVVARDSNFNRVKIKNAAYLAFNRARDILGTSERNCLELVLQGKEDDVIPALPSEIVDRIINIKRGVTTMIKDYDRAYKTFKYASDQISLGNKKTFATIIMGNKDYWSSPMFSIFDGKAYDMKSFISKNRKDGTWADNFLDRILSIIKNY